MALVYLYSIAKEDGTCHDTQTGSADTLVSIYQYYHHCEYQRILNALIILLIRLHLQLIVQYFANNNNNNDSNSNNIICHSNIPHSV